jgi:asparagine synthase (glutamine-hydrolysing)
MAGKDGVKTLFSGWGGDEFVSLSTRGTFNHLFFSFKWKALIKYIQNKGFKSSAFLFKTDVLPLLIPFGLLNPYKSQKTDWFKIRLLKASFVLKYRKIIFFNKSKNLFGYGNRTRFTLNLLHNYHIPERMESWTIFSEKYGFEYKYPLLDKEVLEFWFSIPIEYTYENFHPRLLYREAMKGILTEEIRVRRDKGEGMRIAYTKKNSTDGNQYIINQLLSIPKKEHLPFFNPDLLSKLLNKSPKQDIFKEMKRMQMGTFYLRYVCVVKKYLS